MHESRFATPPGDPGTPKPDQSAGWEPVRDSWTDPPPAVTEATPRSVPPDLPSSVRETGASRSPGDVAFADRMLERLAAGDYAGALLASETLLRHLPRDADALDCAEMARTELRKVYTARLGGDLDCAPSIAMAPEAIATLTLDVFAGFLLSRTDGRTTIQEMLVGQGVAPDRALRVLSELYLMGVIALDR
jgi:hypothetical protein